MKIYKIASTTIGPVYHGTVYNFKPEQLKFHQNVIFFSESPHFAQAYGHQKSQEGKMDADIKVIEAYISGNVFDPQNEQNINKILPFLEVSGDNIRVYNDFGMGADLKMEIFNIWHIR